MPSHWGLSFNYGFWGNTKLQSVASYKDNADDCVFFFLSVLIYEHMLTSVPLRTIRGVISLEYFFYTRLPSFRKYLSVGEKRTPKEFITHGDKMQYTYVYEIQQNAIL